MYYEINVSKETKMGNGIYKHYFATAKRSLDNLNEAKQMVKVFMVKFPEPQFNINVTHYEKVGMGWNAYEFINKEE